MELFLRKFMFKENDVINFGCTKCGKCCEQTPNMSLRDMLELGDEFIFQTAHNVALSLSNSPLDKRQLEYYQMISNSIMMPELEATMFYYVDFAVTPLFTDNSCSKLNDKNECSIYIKRPNSCKLYPLSNKYDDSLQWQVVNFFKERTEKGNWKCDFSPSSSILIKNNEIYSPTYRTIYNVEMENIRDMTDKYISFLSLFGEDKKNNHFKTLFNYHKNRKVLYSSIIIALHCAVFYNMISEDEAEMFIDRQIILLKKEIQRCREIKDKRNVQVSRLYQGILDNYQKFMNSERFKKDFTDQFSM